MSLIILITKPITVTKADDASLLLIDSDWFGARSDAMLRFHSHPFQSAPLHFCIPVMRCPLGSLYDHCRGSFQRDRESIRRAKSLLCRSQGSTIYPFRRRRHVKPRGWFQGTCVHAAFSSQMFWPPISTLLRSPTLKDAPSTRPNTSRSLQHSAVVSVV